MFGIISSFQSTKASLRAKFCAVLIAALAPSLCAAEGYVPSEGETALLTLIRRDDVRAFAEGQKNYAAQAFNIDVATAPEIARFYESGDDAKTNQRFLSRRVLVSGTIEAVWADGPDRTVLAYADTGATQVRAIAHGEQTSRMTAWQVGGKVALVCTGAGGTSRAVTFDDCENADNVARREWDRLDTWFADFYQGKYVPNIMVVTMAVNIAARASRLPADHSCATDSEKCREAVMAIGSLTNDKGLLKDIVQQLVAKGLDFGLLAPVQLKP
ncbi:MULTISPECIES: hypothetical protein [unclassified Burkholderia]|uniref:OB-fold protein n=1 Tax=unclassified Burkholderia TaxID=2613784 RepID=UPI000752FA24|nr:MULTISPECIES: hypothetical protein [unclassified Burkholderia]KUY85570.1 hypothetical protein WS46_00180 [Burkholderia sp. RF4-BP95]